MLTWLVEHAEEEALAFVRPTGEAMRFGDLALAVGETSQTLIHAAGSVANRAVAVAVRDAAGLLVGVLAALEAGGAPVVIDVRAGAALVERQLQLAKPVVVLRDDPASDRLEVHPGHAAPRSVPPEVGLVLFTSGSTARGPKAAVLGGRGLHHVIDGVVASLGLGPEARTPLVLPLGWVYTLVGQALATWRAGGTLLDFTSLPSAGAQLHGMRHLGATNLSSVPSALGVLARAALELPEGERPRPGFVASAGAPLPAETVALLRQAFPGARLFNQYGLTEASGRVSVEADDAEPFARGSVGRPLPGLEVVAVGTAGQPLPVGETGQLRVNGPSIMLGYLDDPEATLAVLGPSGLLTGDLGYVDGDGRLYVTGRADDTIKVGGESVSPREVEETLAGVEGVGELRVLGTTDPITGMRLVCFVAPARGAAPGLVGRLRARAEDALTPPKRPAKIVELETLPHLPNGKVDRLALRRMIELG